MTAGQLAHCDAWLAGWQFLEAGYHWEAHEVWEAVWLALPDGTADRRFVQAAIQTANAALKLRMSRPKATLRLCGIARALLEGSSGALGRSDEELLAWIGDLEAEANLSA